MSSSSSSSSSCSSSTSATVKNLWPGLFGVPSYANGPRGRSSASASGPPGLTAQLLLKHATATNSAGPPVMAQLAKQETRHSASRRPRTSTEQEDAQSEKLTELVLLHQQEVHATTVYQPHKLPLSGEQQALQMGKSDLLGKLHGGLVTSSPLEEPPITGAPKIPFANRFGGKVGYVNAVSRLHRRCIVEAQWLPFPPLLKWLFSACTPEAQVLFHKHPTPAESRGVRHLVGALAREFLGCQGDTIANTAFSRQLLLRSTDDFGPWLACAVGFRHSSDPRSRSTQNKRARDGGLLLSAASAPEDSKPSLNGNISSEWRGGVFIRLPERTNNEVKAGDSAGPSQQQQQQTGFYRVVLDSVWCSTVFENNGVVAYVVRVMAELAYSFQAVVEIDEGLAPVSTWVHLFETELAARHSATHVMRVVTIPFRAPPNETVPMRSPPPSLGVAIERIAPSFLSGKDGMIDELDDASAVVASSSSSSSSSSQSSSSHLGAANEALTYNEALLEFLKGSNDVVGAWSEKINCLRELKKHSTHSDTNRFEYQHMFYRLSARTTVKRTWEEAMTVFCCHLQHLGLPMKCVIQVPFEDPVSLAVAPVGGPNNHSAVVGGALPVPAMTQAAPLLPQPQIAAESIAK